MMIGSNEKHVKYKFSYLIENKKYKFNGTIPQTLSAKKIFTNLLNFYKTVIFK